MNITEEMLPIIENAIHNLRPSPGQYEIAVSNGFGTFISWEDERSVPLWSEIEIETQRLEKIYDYYEYARKRKFEYKSVEEQLDMLYHDIKCGNIENGSWIQHIDSVKNLIPKNTNPKPD